MPGVGSALSSLGYGAMLAFSSLLATERGWIEGRNIHLEDRWADGDLSRMQTLAKELVDLSPDLGC
jgi:hypothetical protein